MLYTLFIWTITVDLLIRAKEDETVAMSIASKRAFELKRLFVNTWQTFAEKNDLTSKETCIFGGHVLRYVMATMKMEDVRRDLDPTSDNWLPEDHFVGNEGDIDIFFKDPKDRHEFIDSIQHVFKMEIVKPKSHYKTDGLPVDMIRLRLASNLQEPSNVFVYIDLVCKKDELIPYSDVKNLQLGPDSTVQRFEHSYVLSHVFRKKSAASDLLDLSRTVNNIKDKCTQLHILPFVEFERLNTTMNEKDYERYWRGLLDRGRQMIREGWEVLNIFESKDCACKNSKEYVEIHCSTSDLSFDIVRACTVCKHVCVIYKN